jgi:hypothetical protein
MLCCVDVFSRWGMAAPMKDLTTATVVEALRKRILQPNGCGKPTKWLIDGGSEFKKDVTSALEAWAADVRMKAPHHSESAGVIERFIQDLEAKMSHFTTENANWLEIYPDALDACNASVSESLSDGDVAAISPAEVWLGRRIRFPSDDRIRTHEWSKNPTVYARQLRQNMIKVKDWVKASRKQYWARLEKEDPRQGKKTRKFEEGDEVTLFKPTGSKREDKLSALQDGPFEVMEVGSSGVDYKIKRLGSNREPHWVHVNEIKKLRRWTENVEAPGSKDQLDGGEEAMEEEDQGSEQGEVLEVAKKSTRTYKVRTIVGERGKTRASKEYRVKWMGHDELTWEPGGNLDCPDKITQWVQRTPAEQTALMEAEGGVLEAMLVANVNHEESDLSTCFTTILMDLGECKLGGVLKEACKKAGIEMGQVAMVVASPPCRTFSPTDATNGPKGFAYRDHKDPERGPRKLDGTPGAKAKRAPGGNSR